jgi:hypothetical protein
LWISSTLEFYTTGTHTTIPLIGTSVHLEETHDQRHAAEIRPGRQIGRWPLEAGGSACPACRCPALGIEEDAFGAKYRLRGVGAVRVDPPKVWGDLAVEFEHAVRVGGDDGGQSGADWHLMGADHLGHVRVAGPTPGRDAREDLIHPPPLRFDWHGVSHTSGAWPDTQGTFSQSATTFADLGGGPPR